MQWRVCVGKTEDEAQPEVGLISVFIEDGFTLHDDEMMLIKEVLASIICTFICIDHSLIQCNLSLLI